ncbi:MAG: segregation/condensation protein A [Sphaerochaetaceae bacterium]|nr:segregation/condensation protein A [Sphaerochaetaceae bacterium]
MGTGTQSGTASHTIPPQPLTYSLREFEGPLDLLLHLIDKAQVSIYSIPISEITDQFMHYLDMASRVDLDDLTEFYLMASHLLLLKSNMLIPHEEVEDERWLEDKQELVEQLLEYQKYKRYSTLLSEAQSENTLLLSRKKSQFMLPFPDEQLWKEVNVWDLLKTFSTLLSTITHDKIFNVYEEVSVKQKLTLMQELFETSESISFIDLVVHEDSRIDIICAFLAILEAVKFRMIIIEQHVLFGDIQIRKAPEEEMEDTPVEVIPESFVPPAPPFSSKPPHQAPAVDDEEEDIDDQTIVISFDDEEDDE